MRACDCWVQIGLTHGAKKIRFTWPIWALAWLCASRLWMYNSLIDESLCVRCVNLVTGSCIYRLIHLNCATQWHLGNRPVRPSSRSFIETASSDRSHWYLYTLWVCLMGFRKKLSIVFGPFIRSSLLFSGNLFKWAPSAPIKFVIFSAVASHHIHRQSYIHRPRPHFTFNHANY